MHPEFVKPRYGHAGFSGLPGRISDTFSAGEADIVILLLVDGFGWRFFESYQDEPLLRRFGRHGRVHQLTAQFPSTTAAHVTCIHTGMPVGESGIYEWNMYEPRVDGIITPLLFSFAGSTERDQLRSTGIDPREIYPTANLYQQLAARGVCAQVFQHREYTPSTFSDVVYQGAVVRPYKSLPEALTNLGLTLETCSIPAYVFLYYDRIDAICHEYGPGSTQVAAEITAFLLIVERLFEQVFRRRGRRVRLMLTADHGLVETDPATTIYINREPRLTGSERFISTNRRNQLLVPAGSPRDFFLHIREELLEEAQHVLSAALSDQAQVVATQELVRAGYFGDIVSERFLQRVGNLVILPHRFESIWWYEKGRFENRYYGHHGGLSPQEMLIPLLELDVTA